MKTVLTQSSLWLGRTAKPSSEGYESKRTQHEAACWLRHLSESWCFGPDSKCFVRSQPSPWLWGSHVVCAAFFSSDHALIVLSNAFSFSPYFSVLFSFCLMGMLKLLKLWSLNGWLENLESSWTGGGRVCVMKGAFDYLIKKSQILTTSDFVSEKNKAKQNKKLSFWKKGFSTTQNCHRMLCHVSCANSGHNIFRHL